MMLTVKKLGDAGYICNFCEQAYDIRKAWYKRGNKYFCSQKCVLDYSELNDHEIKL